MILYPDIWRIPFGASPLVFFTGEFSASLLAGQYEWSAVLQNFEPNRSLTNQAVYFFWDFDFTLDIDSLDFSGAIASTPLVSIYLSSKPNESLFRQPFRCPKFYDKKPILQGEQIRSTPNALQFGITGILNQTAALIGKNSIKAIVQMTAHEITDPDYKKMFKDGLLVPEPPKPAAPMLSEAQKGLAKAAAKTPDLRTEEGLTLPV